MAISKRNHLFQTIILGIHVSFRGCKWDHYCENYKKGGVGQWLRCSFVSRLSDTRLLHRSWGLFVSPVEEGEATKCCDASSMITMKMTFPVRKRKQALSEAGELFLSAAEVRNQDEPSHPNPYWREKRFGSIGGGNSNIIFIFAYRKLGKMNPFWRAYFSMGLIETTN